MAFRWQGFAVPKQGNSVGEYEDAFAGNPKNGRFAVADGASESSFASLWAKLLVHGFVDPLPNQASMKVRLDPLRRQWSLEVDSLQLPWYADAKRGLGASATFLGLALKRSGKRIGGFWSALAVGDCCCFQMREDRLLKNFPNVHSQDFGNQPSLLNSKSEGDHSLQQGDQHKRGKWRSGDKFLLMTDAMAQWFLSRHEEGSNPWEEMAPALTQTRPDDAFGQWVNKLRDQSSIRNDDVTLVVIDV